MRVRACAHLLLEPIICVEARKAKVTSVVVKWKVQSWQMLSLHGGCFRCYSVTQVVDHHYKMLATKSLGPSTYRALNTPSEAYQNQSLEILNFSCQEHKLEPCRRHDWNGSMCKATQSFRSLDDVSSIGIVDWLPDKVRKSQGKYFAFLLDLLLLRPFHCKLFPIISVPRSCLLPLLQLWRLHYVLNSFISCNSWTLTEPTLRERITQSR